MTTRIALLLIAACGTPPRGPSNATAQAEPHVSPPTLVTRLGLTCTDGVKDISVGWSHSCALCSNGDVACWGTNFLGNLGVPLPTERVVPGRVPDVNRVETIAAGSYHTCARLASGQIACWGANNDGQLGDDTNTTRLGPVLVTKLADAKQLDVGLGPGHACAVIGSGGVRCWGVNFNSQLGDGTMTNHASPVTVAMLDDATQVSTGAYHTCALRRSGKVACWGGSRGRDGRLSIPVPRDVPGLVDATQVAAGGEHTCALRKTGTVACWGMNGAGQLGDGTWADQPAPVEVRGLANVTSIDSASNHTCALLASREVVCWGANEHGQLGDGSTTHRNEPVAVAALGDVATVSTGHRSSCARTQAGQVLCWGELDQPLSETPPPNSPAAPDEPPARSRRGGAP